MSGQPEGMPLSQWSLVYQSYLGAIDPTGTRLLQQVETKVEDPVAVDNTTMRCRWSNEFPEVSGSRRGNSCVEEFGPSLPSRFQGMLQALLSTTRMDDPVQTISQWDSRVKVYEEQPCGRVSENIKLATLAT